jgi:ankyrin repeat protein
VSIPHHNFPSARISAVFSDGGGPWLVTYDDVDIHSAPCRCDGGKPEVVKILLDAQADVNQPDTFNQVRRPGPVLRVWSYSCSSEARSSFSPLTAARSSRALQQDTPLHLACEGGFTEVVRILLEHGGQINAQDQMNGETPLHLACEAGYSDIIQLLLDYGADTSIENVYKKRPLDYANETTMVRH